MKTSTLLSLVLNRIIIALVALISFSQTAQAQYEKVFVTPSYTEVSVYQSLQYHAYGVNKKGDTTDITDKVKWTSVYPNRFTIDKNGKGQAIESGLYLVLATYPGKASVQAMGVVKTAIETLLILGPPFVQVDSTISLSLRGVNSNNKMVPIKNTKAKWKIYTFTQGHGKIVKEIGVGKFKALKDGTVLITATLENNTMGHIRMEIGNLIKSMNITPGDTSILVQDNYFFAAHGVFENGERKNISNEVTWYSSDTNVASMTPQGHFVAKSAGNTKISAVYIIDGNSTPPDLELPQNKAHARLFDTVNIKVIDPLLGIHYSPKDTTLLLGKTFVYTVIGDFQIGPDQNITDRMSWTSSNKKVASIGKDGTLRTHYTGLTTITGKYEDKEITSSVTVNNPITGASVKPSRGRKYYVGDTMNFVFTLNREAAGKPQVVSNKAVEWDYLNSSLVKVLGPGQVLCKASGDLVVQADLLPTRDNKDTLNTFTEAYILEPVDSIAFNSPYVLLGHGDKVPFEINGYFKDGSVKDVTHLIQWSSSASNVVNFSSNQKNLLDAVGYGYATIYAKLPFSEAKTASVGVTVLDPMKSIEISPSDTSIFLSKHYTAFSATGIYASGKTEDLTEKVEWSVSNVAIGAVIKGIFLAVKSGNVELIAAFENLIDSTQLSVVEPLDSVWMLPKDSIYTSTGNTISFDAGAFSSKNTPYSPKSPLVWSSGNSNILEFNDATNQAVVKAYGSVEVIVTIPYDIPVIDTVLVHLLPIDSIWMKPSFTFTGNTYYAYENMKMSFETGITVDGGDSYLPKKPLVWSSNDTSILSFAEGKNVATFNGNGNVWVKLNLPYQTPASDSIQLDVALLDSISTWLRPPVQSGFVDHDTLLVGQFIIYDLYGHFSNGERIYLNPFHAPFFPDTLMIPVNDDITAVRAITIGRYTGAGEGKRVKVGMKLAHNDDFSFITHLTVLDSLYKMWIDGPDTTFLGIPPVQYLAMGNYGQIGKAPVPNSYINWSVSPSNGVTASIDSFGVLSLTNSEFGSVDVTAYYTIDPKYQYGIGATKTVTVSSVPDMEIYPKNPIIFLPDTIQYSLYTDSLPIESSSVKWSNLEGSGSITPQGSFSPFYNGDYHIVAAVGQSMDTLRVKAVNLKDTYFTPYNQNGEIIPLGDSVHFKAFGTYTNNPNGSDFDTLEISEKEYWIRESARDHWTISGAGIPNGTIHKASFLAKDTGTVSVRFNVANVVHSRNFKVLTHYDSVSVGTSKVLLHSGQSFSLSSITLFNTKTGEQKVLNQSNSDKWSYQFRVEPNPTLAPVSNRGRTVTAPENVSTGREGSLNISIGSYWGNFEKEINLVVEP